MARISKKRERQLGRLALNIALELREEETMTMASARRAGFQTALKLMLPLLSPADRATVRANYQYWYERTGWGCPAWEEVDAA